MPHAEGNQKCNGEPRRVGPGCPSNIDYAVGCAGAPGADATGFARCKKVLGTSRRQPRAPLRRPLVAANRCPGSLKRSS
jgi:hypothetical protein